MYECPTEESRIMHQLFYTLTSIILVVAISTLTACQPAAIKLQKEAIRIGLEKDIIATKPIPIVIYKKIAAKNRSRLYIYIEGDGQPWDKGYWPASDPNTRKSVVLPLLAQQLLQQSPLKQSPLKQSPLKQSPLKHAEYNAIYLARPCYAWKTMPKNCTHFFWTSGRYSETVVDILNQGMDAIKQQYNINQFVLVGHSGGGTLAMLLAARRKDISAIITLSANLNHSAWTHYFGYLPLSDSLNPATQQTLPKKIPRWHLIGEQDHTIPSHITYQAGQKDPYAHLTLYTHFDHSCCWQIIWESILMKVQQTLKTKN